MGQQIVGNRIVDKGLHTAVGVGDRGGRAAAVIGGDRGVTGDGIRGIVEGIGPDGFVGDVAPGVVGHRGHVTVVVDAQALPVGVRVVGKLRNGAERIDLRGDVATIIVVVSRWVAEAVGDHLEPAVGIDAAIEDGFVAVGVDLFDQTAVGIVFGPQRRHAARIDDLSQVSREVGIVVTELRGVELAVGHRGETAIEIVEVIDLVAVEVLDVVDASGRVAGDGHRAHDRCRGQILSRGDAVDAIVGVAIERQRVAREVPQFEQAELLIENHDRAVTGREAETGRVERNEVEVTKLSGEQILITGALEPELFVKRAGFIDRLKRGGGVTDRIEPVETFANHDPKGAVVGIARTDIHLGASAEAMGFAIGHRDGDDAIIDRQHVVELEAVT